MSIFGSARLLSNNLQANTTNTTPGQIVQCGWGGAVGSGTGVITVSVTFPVAFSVAPIVVATYGGDQSGTTIAYGNGAVTINNGDCWATSITTTGFTLRIQTISGTWSNAQAAYGQWIAIGAP